MKKTISIALSILMALSATGGLIKMIEQLKKEFDKIENNNTVSVQTGNETSAVTGETYQNYISSDNDMNSLTTSSPVANTTDEKNDTTKPPETTKGNMNEPDQKTEQSTTIPTSTTEIIITTSIPNDDIELPAI